MYCTMYINLHFETCGFLEQCKELSLQDKNKAGSEKWKSVSEREKEKYWKTVDEIKCKKSVSNLGDQQRKKLTKRHQKQFLEEVHLLYCILYIYLFLNESSIKILHRYAIILMTISATIIYSPGAMVNHLLI